MDKCVFFVFSTTSFWICRGPVKQKSHGLVCILNIATINSYYNVSENAIKHVLIQFSECVHAITIFPYISLGMDV